MPAPLDDVLAQFAALADDSAPVRHIRGTALAVAQDWLIRLPDGPGKAKAIDALADAADLAVATYGPN